MSPVLLLLAVGAYMALLFCIAWRADRAAPLRAHRRALVYALSLGVYCTSWTYFGAVGTAARSGWDFLPIYLGPALALWLGFPLWRRIAEAAKRENVGSIADFLAARYGKSRALGALVAVVATLGSLPYIALQLKSLATGWALLTEGSPDAAPTAGAVLVIAVALAGFAILFGARRADLTEHNRGLVEAIAFESIVKLTGLLAAALLAVALLAGHGEAPEFGALAAWPELDARFLVLTALSAAAIFCLPRQFHVGFVELADPADAREARRSFLLYLALTTLAVVPILAAGALLPAGYANPDLYVLDLPLLFGGAPLTLLVFLGGFSAAAAMVIVEAVALSAMLSNELILPFLARQRWRLAAGGNAAAQILLVRRAAIGLVLLCAFLYFQTLRPGQDLASIGLVAFAAAAQFAPALVGAVLWRRASAAGALAGLATGFFVWLNLLFLPQLLPALDPARFLGLGDPLVFGALASLSLNSAVFITVSRRGQPRLLERIQAAAFTAPQELQAEQGAALAGRVGDLKELVVRFLGEEAAMRGFADLARELNRPLRDADPVDPTLARAVERRLAGAVGASSARGVIAAALSGEAGRPGDVTRLLDETAQAVQFSRELLQAALDNMSQAVSVIDAELRLSAWNARYLELFEFPPGFIHVGKPVAEVIRYNAERGECGPGGIEAHVEKRLDHLRRRARHSFERLRPDGRVIRSMGAPMPGGGYVTTYGDVTEDKRREILLEERVAERTRELAEATALAEAATASKTRFLAAASHDLLQPLNAARLFVAALAEELQAPAAAGARRHARDADRAIAAADRLLRALLNLSKLEAGGVQPEVRPVSAGALLGDLEREFFPLAAEKGLRFRVRPTQAWVRSDPDLLRSVLQNLVGNAIRYTDKGGVLLGVRRSGAHLHFEVWDTGRGIAEAEQRLVFREFTRAGSAAGAEAGMGLGLAIVDRVARLLGHGVSLRSQPGRGSLFRVAAPWTPAPVTAPLAGQPRGASQALCGLRVLCVDNEPAILESLTALLARWGAEVVPARSALEARALAGGFDAALIDHQLGAGESGLALLEALGDRLGQAALVTAETDETVLAAARALGAVVLKKPVEPAALRAFLSRARLVAAE